MIDSHCHLNDGRFSRDRKEVITRARAAGLTGFVVVGYDEGSSRLALELAEQEPDVWAAVGMHPHDASEVKPQTLEQMRRLAEHERVVALGETGLDYYRNLSPPPVQRAVFADFITLAAEVNLPLIVHCREAQDDCLAALDEHRQPEQTVIMHCFAGGPEFARECLQRGFVLGIAGTVTYPKSVLLREVAATAPAEALLLETDCPWLPPQSHRSQRNEPAYLVEVAEQVAAAREWTLQQVAEQTEANTRRVFGITLQEPGS